MYAAYQKTDQSHCHFVSGIGAAAYATLDTEQLSPGLQMLILLVVHRNLMDRLLQCKGCVSYLPRFMTFSRILCIKELAIQLIFKHFFLILLPGSIVK